MNLPLPDFKDMSPMRFIMWVCAALLAFTFLIIPGSFEGQLKGIAETQAKMMEEHTNLLRAAQVQCYNHAENVSDKEARARQQRRCLTLQIDTYVAGD